MPGTDMSLIGQMDDYILDGKFHDATDVFCRLAVDGHDINGLMTHAMQTAAPYLHVPSHQKLLPNGEFRNVNYDHTILGFRAGLRLMPYLSEAEKYLTMVQAMYYVPQGLDVWAQLECGFPGHYAREQEQCTDEQLGHELHCHFEDREPLLDGSVDDRFARMFHAFVHGDRETSYRLFLGLAAQPELRERLCNETLLASIIDQQEFNSFRKVRHIGHKAIRTRSMLDLADHVGWENAHPYFYIAVPDIATSPLFHSLYDHASFLLGVTFKGDQYNLHERNTELLSEAEQDQFIGQIMEGDPRQVAHAITALLQARKSLNSILDTVMLAHATHCVYKLRAPIAYTVPMHSFDYCNVVSHWVNNYSHPHQAKAVYLSAWFVTDIINEIDWYPDVPGVVKPDPAPFKDWADGLALPNVLAELEGTIAAQDPSRSVALVQSYIERTAERDQLIHMLVHCAAKYQGDAHIFRNARSIIETYSRMTCSEARKHVLFLFWAHYLSYYRKRTLETDCYDMYYRHFVN